MEKQIVFNVLISTHEQNPGQLWKENWIGVVQFLETQSKESSNVKLFVSGIDF